jgi:hypothetical protein
MGDGLVCMIGGRCSGIGLFEPPGTISSLQVSLLEDSPGMAAAGPSRRVTVPDGVAVGRQAALLASRAARGAIEPRIVFSLAGAMEGGTAVFRSPAGDGFALARQSDGPGAHLVVSALESGRPGRTLADERVSGEEALIVRVPFEGRTRVLVVQAATLSEAEARERDPAIRRALQAGQIGRPQQLRPPFELSVLDR